MQSFYRRALAVSAAGVCLLGLGTLVVAPAVAAISQAAVETPAQSFELSSAASASTSALAMDTAAARDDFGVTEFTLVQYPVGAGTTISSFFGGRSCSGCSSFHSGIDFTPGAGAPIHAVADGRVVGSTVADGSWGVHVTVEHDVDGVIYRSSYAHMQSGSLTVSLGDKVKRGQVLGLVGNTGQSFGAHLHFTIQDAHSTFIDPLAWLRKHVNIGD